MNVDDIFKVPNLPSGLNKRKLPDNPTPEMLKKLKVGEAASTRPTIEDVSDEDDAMSSSSTTVVERNRDFAPGGDADYFTEEDDEGRFFGGGLTTEQKDILQIFEDANQGEDGVLQDIEDMSITGIRRILLRFERAVNKNSDQRSKYPDDPAKFIDSESDLDVALKSLLPLAQNPTLAYTELVKSETIIRLIGLLSHENIDIVIDVVEVIHELSDEDVGEEDGDEDEEEQRVEATRVLMNGLLENSVLELLVDNLGRFNEKDESDRSGIFHILSIFENFVGFDPDLAPQLILNTKLLPWLLQHIQGKSHDENRSYAAELLSILLQNETRNKLELGKQDGVEIILSTLAQFRRRDPVDADETEFMENLFDALCSALSEGPIKELFLKSEGVDLMCLMLKDKFQSRSRAIKALDYATSGPEGTASCEAFVDALGLKSIFSALMTKPSKKLSHQTAAEAATAAQEDTQHALGIISSLFSNLDSDTPARVRLLAKFVESGYDKVDKMIELRESALSRLQPVEKAIEAQKKEWIDDGEVIDEEAEESFYLRRLEGGLFTLQSVDYVLAWIAMEDDGIRSHLLSMLDRKGATLKDIVFTLTITRDNIDEPDDNSDPDRPPSRGEILQGLINFLDGI